jgi:hypothetical protein
MRMLMIKIGRTKNGEVAGKPTKIFAAMMHAPRIQRNTLGNVDRSSLIVVDYRLWAKKRTEIGDQKK